MNFNDLSWHDSDIENITIEYDRLILKIFNDTIQKTLCVQCSGFAGCSELFFWDDTIILEADIYETGDAADGFLNKLYNTYDKDFDYGGRHLGTGLLELRIKLTNFTCFSVYCQKIEIKELDS